MWRGRWTQGVHLPLKHHRGFAPITLMFGQQSALQTVVVSPAGRLVCGESSRAFPTPIARRPYT